MRSDSDSSQENPGVGLGLAGRGDDQVAKRSRCAAPACGRCTASRRSPSPHRRSGRRRSLESNCVISPRRSGPRRGRPRCSRRPRRAGGHGAEAGDKDPRRPLEAAVFIIYILARRRRAALRPVMKAASSEQRKAYRPGNVIRLAETAEAACCQHRLLRLLGQNVGEARIHVAWAPPRGTHAAAAELACPSTW